MKPFKLYKDLLPTIYCIGAILLLSPSNLQAQKQQKALDSLLTVLKSMPSDTSKVQTYGQISRLYAINLDNAELATVYLDSVQLLSNQLQYETGKSYGFFLQGLINYKSGNYDKSLESYEKAHIGYLKAADSTYAISALQGMAQAYRQQGAYEKSLELLLRAAKFYEGRDPSYPLAVSYTGIANLFRVLEKFDSSITYHRKSLDILKSLGYTNLYAMGLQNMANVYVEKEDSSAALELYEEAYTIIKKSGNKHREAFILGNMGYLYGELDYLNKAVEYQTRALGIWKQLSQQNNAIESLDNLGSLHLKLKRFDKALFYHHEALSLANEAGAKEIIPEIYNGLSKAYAAKGDHKNAHFYNDRFWSLKDSLFNIEKAKQINELQTQYETEKKDQQITLLAQEKEIQENETARQATLKNAFIAGVLLLGLLAGLAFYTFRQRLKNERAIASKNEEIKEVNFKRRLTELEMKALQAQINPHFIFNCMSAINQMILDEDNRRASKYLTKFSKLIRLILENAEENEVSLKSELDLLEAYIQLESLRFEGDIKYDIEVLGVADVENTYLPAMVLQPFIENAIWHGLRHKEETHKGKISIAIEQIGNRLIGKIEDNGVGREKALQLQQKAVYKNKSMGLKITEDRLKLLSNGIKEQLVKITDLKDKTGSPSGTLVEVFVPIS